VHYIINSESDSNWDKMWGVIMTLILVCLIVALFLSRESSQKELVTKFTYGLSAPLVILFVIHFIRYYNSPKKNLAN
jgi:uncharacterized integral membrane protein